MEDQADADPSISPHLYQSDQGKRPAMVRNYRPKNPVDPGSKLGVERTMEILTHILYGKKSAWIAEHHKVSKNTVSAISARFRRKIRSSETIRQACFEPFYELGLIDKTVYTHLLDGPEGVRPDYFSDLANCIFRCPSQFSVKTSEWPGLIAKTKTRILNKDQTSRYFNKTAGPMLHVRQHCQKCPMMEKGPITPLGYYVAYDGFLRERSLRAEHVEEYYYLFLIIYMLLMWSLHVSGVSWKDNEMIFPGEATWEEHNERLAQVLGLKTLQLSLYIGNALIEDPLN
jgi:hypothetical protein